MTRSAPWFVLVIALVGLILARESRQPAGSLAGVDRAFLDWLSANAKPAATMVRAAPAVTLIEIDDAIATTPGRWPLTALDYACFLQIVQKYDPAVVAIAPVIELPPAAGGSEQILLDQALTVSRLLLSVQLGIDAPAGRDPANLADFLPVGAVTGSTGRVPEFTELTVASDGRLGLLAAASGAINLPGDQAAPVRDVPLLFRWRGKVVPAFTLQALTLALQLSPREVEVVAGSHIRMGERLRLPIDRAGRALIDAQALKQINRLQFDELPLLATGQAGPDSKAAAEKMRGGVVILGRTDREARRLRTAAGDAITPAQVFAWAVASLEQEPPLHRAAWWQDVAVVAAYAVVGCAGLALRKTGVTLLAGMTLAVYALVALACFETSHLWLPAALPCGLTVVNAFLPWVLTRHPRSMPGTPAVPA